MATTPGDTMATRPAARGSAYNADEEPVLSFEELDARVVATGSILFILADLFYFASWFFAFFYLRSWNSNNHWLPKGVTHPSRAFGAFVIALIVLSALSVFAGARSGRVTPLWFFLGTIGFILGVGAAFFGGYQLWHLGFGMKSGGYASVYVGLWGSIAVQVVGAMFWLLSALMQSRPGGDTELRPASTIGFSRILLFMAAMSVVSYLILYFMA